MPIPTPTPTPSPPHTPPIPHALSLSLGRFRALFRLDEVPIEHFWKFLGLSMLSGASSGAVCLAVLYPLDFARTRVGTDIRSSGNRQFTGSIDCLRQAYSTVVSWTAGRLFWFEGGSWRALRGGNRRTGILPCFL